MTMKQHILTGNSKWWLSVLGVCLAGSPVRAEKPEHQKLSQGDLATTLSIFNLRTEQPRERQDVLRSAYAFLSADRQRTIAALAVEPGFQNACRAAALTHLGGPMLGCVSATGATVWIRTLAPAQVTVEAEVAGRTLTFGPVASTVDTDLGALVPVSGLPSGSTIPYRVRIDGKLAEIPAHAAIRTLPAGNANVRIAFGSCQHRWGLGNAQLSDQIRERNPAALLLLGDVAVQDRRGHLGLHRMDFLMRDLTPPWQQLCATVPVYVTWDDHDYFDNDLAGLPKGFTEADRTGVRKVFTQSWNNPAYGSGENEGRGTFLRTRIGPCDVIMTDNRTFREGRQGSFLGDAQMAWLKQQLAACKGPFIILSCGTMWSDDVSNGKDSWGKCDPAGREEIFRWIEENRIAGVLLLSGDRHGARGLTLPRGNGFKLYEFGGASLGGRIGPPAKSPAWTTQLYGIAGDYAFSEFEFDTAKDDPEVTLRLMGEKGDVIHAMTLKRGELTPPKRP